MKHIVMLFKLYSNGFSYSEIKSLTGLSLQTRVEDKTLPEIIIKYGGVDLTFDQGIARQSKCQDIKARAVDGFKRAEALQAESGKEHLAKLKLLWVKDPQSLETIINLY
jgi:hypothetical protein